MENTAFWEREWNNGYGKVWYPKLWYYWVGKSLWFDYRFSESNSKRS